MVEDADLIRSYADEKSEAAFAELVRRHLTPVYAFALRRVGGDAHLAEDVAQIVFTTLARKASSLTDRQVLGGWLCRTAHFAARDVVRAESRRRAREAEAQIMHDPFGDDSRAKIDWAKLQPILAQTMGELNDDDRDAVWLRFFEGRSFADVGERLRLNENTVRMRVDRALDKLHSLLARKGINSTAAALGVALANQAAMAAPSTLAASVTGAALAAATNSAMAGAAAGTASLKAMFLGMTKLQVGVLGAVIIASAGDWLIQQHNLQQLRRELNAVPKQTHSLSAVSVENDELTQTIRKVADLRKAAAELESIQRMAENMRLTMAEFEQIDLRDKRVAQAQADLASPVIGPIFAPNEVDVPPRAVSPQDVWRNELAGEVVVNAVIDADGRVREVSVLRSTLKQYEDAVVRTVKEWDFAPARKNGRSVNARVEIPVTFTAVPSGGAGSSLTLQTTWF